GITIQQAYMLLDSDIDICLKELDRYHPGWTAHCSARQNVLIELSFNLGLPRLDRFIKFWVAMHKRDYEAAADEMLNSLWAEQVGQRAHTLAQQMRSGEYAQF